MFKGKKDRELFSLAKMPKEEFISFCYRNLLARNSEEEEARRAREDLASGKSRFELMNTLVNSQEFYEKLSSRLFGIGKPLDACVNLKNVFCLYEILLDRDPTQEEIDLALREGPSVRFLRDHLMFSEEFQQKNPNLEFLYHSTIVLKEFSDRLRIFIDLAETGPCEPILRSGAKENEIRYLRSVLNPGDVCFDVGAGFGLFSLVMAEAVGDTGQVHSFEPLHERYELLQRSVRENQFEARVQCYQVALASQKMQSFLVCEGEKGRPVRGSAYISYSEEAPPYHHLRPVQVEKLDALKMPGPVALIKLSVAGAHPFVIHGGKSVLQRDKPIIMMNLSRENLAKVADSTPEEMLKALRELDYRCFEVTGEGLKGPIERFSHDGMSVVFLHKRAF